MSTEIFKAGVQYNDWTGTVAADDDDTDDLYKWIEDNKLKEENEFLIGFESYVHSLTNAVSVKLLFLACDGYDNVEAKLNNSDKAVEVRVVRKDIPIIDFIKLFKRLNMVFSRTPSFEGREYKEID